VDTRDSSIVRCRRDLAGKPQEGPVLALHVDLGIGRDNPLSKGNQSACEIGKTAVEYKSAFARDLAERPLLGGLQQFVR
jgi:hypothetical protein